MTIKEGPELKIIRAQISEFLKGKKWISVCEKSLSHSCCWFLNRKNKDYMSHMGSINERKREKKMWEDGDGKEKEILEMKSQKEREQRFNCDVNGRYMY